MPGLEGADGQQCPSASRPRRCITVAVGGHLHSAPFQLGPVTQLGGRRPVGPACFTGADGCNSAAILTGQAQLVRPRLLPPSQPLAILYGNRWARWVPSPLYNRREAPPCSGRHRPCAPGLPCSPGNHSAGGSSPHVCGNPNMSSLLSRHVWIVLDVGATATGMSRLHKDRLRPGLRTDLAYICLCSSLSSLLLSLGLSSRCTLSVCTLSVCTLSVPYIKYTKPYGAVRCVGL